MSDKMEPRRDRPDMKAYGVDPISTEGLLEWDWFRERMTNAHNYWVCSTRPDGRPHAMPVWAIWHNETIYFISSRTSRKNRNLAANPEVVIHLESGAETVILEGRVEAMADDWAGFESFADAYEAKYPGNRPETGIEEVTFRVVPRLALAWTEANFPKSSTRWTF